MSQMLASIPHKVNTSPTVQRGPVLTARLYRIGGDANFKLRFAWKDEGCFGKIHLNGQRLHLFVGQTACVGKTANGLPASGVWGKNIKLNEIVAGSHVRKYLFV
jgi:hypothetical protein